MSLLRKGIRVKFYITTLNVTHVGTSRQPNAVSVKPYIQVGKFECISIVRYSSDHIYLCSPDDGGGFFCTR